MVSNPGIAQGAAVLGGIFFIVSGNLLPKMNANAFFGIRTPWSMSSPEAWRKTQRFGGRGCIIVSLAMIVCAFAFEAKFVTFAVLALLLAFLGVSMLVSYLAYRKESSIERGGGR